jgi:signal transduction histidine kinase
MDAFLVLLVCLQLLELWLARPQQHTVAGVLLTAMTTATLLLRHRAPVAATLLCLAAHATLVQLQPSGLSTTFFALLVALAVIGGLPTTAAVAGLVGAVGVAAEGAWLDVYGGGIADFAMSTAVLGAAWVLGWMLARRDHSIQEARARAAEAEQEQRRAAEEAVALERARVTRELHDVVAHGLTVLVVQTVAAQEDIQHGAAPETVLSRLSATEQVARQSLGELRMLLGMLHEVDSGPAPEPEGGLAGVTALVDQLRGTGLRVRLDVTGTPTDLGPGLDLTVYRVVQESLTNVVKHGAGGEATVSLSFDGDRVGVTVLSDLPAAARSRAPGAGRGLAGLRERTAMYGGEFDAGPDGGRFRVRCSLPVQPHEAAGHLLETVEGRR